MSTKLNHTIIAGLRTEVRKALHDYARSPTSINEAFIVGYLKAANAFGGLLGNHYDYLLALTGGMFEDATLANEVFNETMNRSN